MLTLFLAEETPKPDFSLGDCQMQDWKMTDGKWCPSFPSFNFSYRYQSIFIRFGFVYAVVTYEILF